MISKNHRFHGLGSLRPVYQRGRSVRGAAIGLRYQLNSRRTSYRAAVVVSRKVNKSAVKRNRIRRRIYEVIRLQEANINQSHDIIFSVFSDQVLDWSSTKLTKEITALLSKAAIIKSNN